MHLLSGSLLLLAAVQQSNGFPLGSDSPLANALRWVQVDNTPASLIPRGATSASTISNSTSTTSAASGSMQGIVPAVGNNEDSPALTSFPSVSLPSTTALAALGNDSGVAVVTTSVTTMLTVTENADANNATNTQARTRNHGAAAQTAGASTETRHHRHHHANQTSSASTTLAAVAVQAPSTVTTTVTPETTKVLTTLVTAAAATASSQSPSLSTTTVQAASSTNSMVDSFPLAELSTDAQSNAGLTVATAITGTSTISDTLTVAVPGASSTTSPTVAPAGNVATSGISIIPILSLL